ncbi:MAG: hypothetical protein V1670_03150, partial [Candidatus Omnitrophota bacterium]
MELKLLITLFIFGSITALAYVLIPFLLARFSQSQVKRMEKTSKELHTMFIYTEKRRLLTVFTVTPLVMGTLGFLLSHNFWVTLASAG